MSEQDTSAQAVSRGVSPESNVNASRVSTRSRSPIPGDGGPSVDPAREREGRLKEAIGRDVWETGKFLSPMFSTTSSPLVVDYDWELFDPPLTVEWSVVDEDGPGNDLSDFLLTVKMPRLLKVKTLDDNGEETTENRYIYDTLASAILLAFHDSAANEYVPNADNLKHRIFFAMQRLETETSFIPPKVRSYVKDKGGTRFDRYGSWSIKVGPNEDASTSQTIKFDLEKPLGWNPYKADASVISDLIAGAGTGKVMTSGYEESKIVLGDGLDETAPSEPDRS
ncbi:hypothetical protein EHS25_001305 [Saitozyma podzolica]|uniref:Uncharacterized protein n=1 Tax=Saitozyma podzolica TaxID=1890683 RepID=A0A427YHZ5_9TREE|nr:hypothetical protein EHS25_001305 [Saitozyma podzolica]